MTKQFKHITTIIATLSFACIITVGCLVLTSCEKENNTSDSTRIPSLKGNSNIPHFETFEELEKAIDMATSFETTEELLAFEKSQGRSSIGAIANAFYETINPESFKDKKEALDFYLKNTNLLDSTIHKDGISILPKFFTTPLRFIANEDGIFSLGKKYYKLFNEGLVSTDTEHLNELSNLNENELEKIDTSIFHFSNSYKDAHVHDGCSNKWIIEASRQQGMKRIVVGLRTDVIDNYVKDWSYIYYQHYQSSSYLWYTERNYLILQGDVNIHSLLDEYQSGHDSDLDYEALWRNKNYTIYPVFFPRKALSMYTTFHYGNINSYNIVFHKFDKTLYHYSAFHLVGQTPDISISLNYN